MQLPHKKKKLETTTSCSKLVNATFEVENDFSEYQLRNALEGMGGKYIKTLPNTEHLKDDAHFKSLLKSKKQAQENLDRYINSRRNHSL